MSAKIHRLALVCVPLAAAGLLAWAALPAVRGQAGGQRRQEVADRAHEVLKQHCFKCHGDKPDEVEKFSFLDRPALEKKKVIVPGKPDDSKLIRRVTDTVRPMPPKSSGQPALAGVEVEILRDWIAAGAPALSDRVVAVKPPAPVDRSPQPAQPSATNVRDIFARNCSQCHGGAQPRVFSIDNRDQLLAKGVVVAREPDRSSLLDRIKATGEDRMPPEGDGRRPLTPAEIDAVRAWIATGAPAFEEVVPFAPGQVGDEYVLRAILKDVRALAAAGERLEAYRYFSLNHLLAGGISRAELDYNRQALTLVVNHLSRKPDFAIPRAVEPTGTVFRVDISQLGWDQQPFEKEVGGKKVAADDFTLFDAVLLDYPYGLMYDGSRTYRELATEFLGRIRQVRPVAFVRADWFVNTASRPPLYEDLLQLPFSFYSDPERSIGGLEKQLGLDVKKNVEKFRTRRAGFTLSGVSRNNRIVERHAPNNAGYLWLSYDYKSNKGSDNIFQDPVHLNPTGGEMIFRLPNGLQGYYVANGKGTRLEAAPTEIVTDLFASDQTVRTGLACMRCHALGMRTFHDSVRTVVEQLPASPTAFERDDALGLYPRQAVMDRFVEKDQKSFLQAVNRLYGLGPDQAPPKIDLMLDRVSRRFLDEPLNVQTAATELGMAKPERIQAAFQNRELAAAGLMPLASGGTVRRDTWEDFYDQVADHFGRGVPIVPIDGVTRPEYQRPDTRVTFEPKANRKTFGKGDVLVITVKNTSAAPLFLEAVLSGNEGQKVMLTDTVTRVEAGATIRFPPGEGKGFEMSGVTGKEQVVVYAAEKQFPKGEVLLFPEKDGDAGFGMADRVVHRQFFRLSENGGRPAFDPSRMVKKTIEIETQ